MNDIHAILERLAEAGQKLQEYSVAQWDLTKDMRQELNKAQEELTKAATLLAYTDLNSNN